MNIAPRPKSIILSKYRRNNIYTVYNFNLATSHYPSGTILDMNNFISTVFHRDHCWSLRSDLYHLYNNIKYGGKIFNKGNLHNKVGVIACPDYLGSRSGNSRTSLSAPDHYHVLVLARNASEQNAIKCILDNIGKKFAGFGYEDTNSSKGSMSYFASYVMKAYFHEQTGVGNSSYDPICLPFQNTAPKRQMILADIATNRSMGMTLIPNKVTLS